MTRKKHKYKVGDLTYYDHIGSFGGFCIVLNFVRFIGKDQIYQVYSVSEGAIVEMWDHNLRPVT